MLENPTENKDLLKSNKTTFHTNLEIERYYKNKQNYMDDVPYDVLSMVRISKE